MTSRIVQIRRRLMARARRIGRHLKLGPSPVILMYHRIAHASFDPWGLAVTPAHFAQQLDWLKTRRTILPLSTFAQLHLKGQLPRNAVSITFDDGYACNGETAAPLMAARDVPGTIFICPDLIHRGEECWWDDLERIVLQCPGRQLTLRIGAQEELVELGERSPQDLSWPADQPPATERQRAFLSIWSRLLLVRPDVQQAAVADLRRQAELPAEPRNSHRLMTAEGVRSAMQMGISIGAHSLTHTSLSQRTPEEQVREIAGSRSSCADLTGVEPDCFAYPYGDFNDDSERIVEQAGFACACTTNKAPVRKDDPLSRLPRLRVENWTPGELGRALRDA